MLQSRLVKRAQGRRSLEKRAIGGDKRAFGELLHKHDPTMRAIAWKILGDIETVDDATQDAYLKAYRSVERFRGESEFGTWLHRIVVNSCVDQLRRRSRLHEVSIEVNEELSVPPADDRLSDSEYIRQALLLLPAEQRVAVLLVNCEGYSYDEAADVLGISTGAIGSRLFRARTKLEAIGQPA